MSMRCGTKYVHEGPYVAAIEVEWIDSDTGWSPYMSMDDAQRLDEAKDALRKGDFRRAAQFGRVYELTPLAV